MSRSRATLSGFCLTMSRGIDPSPPPTCANQRSSARVGKRAWVSARGADQQVEWIAHQSRLQCLERHAAALIEFGIEHLHAAVHVTHQNLTRV
jgi:hypothetical protein